MLKFKISVVILLILLSCSGSASAALTLRQAYSGYPATSISSISVVTGDLIVVGYSYGSTAVDATVSDTVNSYTLVDSKGGRTATANTGVMVWYAIASTTTTLTISCSSKSDGGMSVMVYSGAAASPLSNHSTYADTGGTSHTTSGMSVSATSGTLYAYWAQESASSTDSAADGWTKQESQSGHEHSTMDKPFTSSGFYTASMTSSAGVPYICVFAAFSDSSAIDGSSAGSVIVNDALANDVSVGQ